MAPCPVDVEVGDFNPHDAVRAGLTALPNAVAEAAGGLVTNGSGTGQMTVSGGLVAVRLLEAPYLVTGTAQAGAASTITLAAGASATDSLYLALAIAIVSGTGAGQSRVITAYVGSTKVATVDRAWATNPDNTSVYVIMKTPSPKLDASQQVVAASVQGNVTGSVASVTAGVTVTTLNDKTGLALSATGLDAITIADISTDSDSRSSVVKLIRAIYNRLYNKVTQTATTQTVYNDAGTVGIITMTCSESGGTATKGRSA